MRVEVAGLRLVVVAQRGLVGEARGVAEQHAQGDPLFGVWLEGAVDGEAGQVPDDRCVEVELSGLDGLHHRRGGEDLGHRLDAEDGVDGDRRAPVAVGGAEPLLPHHPVAVDQRHGQAGDVLLGHEPGNPGPVALDHRGDPVARGGRYRDGGRTAPRHRKEHPNPSGNRRTDRSACGHGHLRTSRSRKRGTAPRTRAPAHHHAHTTVRAQPRP